MRARARPPMIADHDDGLAQPSGFSSWMAQEPGFLVVAAGRLRADHPGGHLAPEPDVDDRHAGHPRHRARRRRRTRGRLAGAAPRSPYRRRDPRPARARRCRRAHPPARVRRDLRQLGRDLGEAEPSAGQDPGLAHRPRHRQRPERQGRRAGGRSRDPHDAAERDLDGHRRSEVAAVLPRVRDAQHAVRAQGRTGHAPLHQPAYGRARAGRRRRHDERREVAAQLLPRRHDHRGVQRHRRRGRGAHSRRAARGDDRDRHVRGCLRAVRRRVGRRCLRGADRARHRGHGRGAHHGCRRAACERRASAADPAVRHGRNARTQPARGARRHDRGRLPVRNGRIDARRPVDLRGRAHRQRTARPRRLDRSPRRPARRPADA